MTGAARPILVGVDAGSTRSSALAVRPSGAVVGRADGPGANPKRQGLAVSAARIAALAAEAAGPAGDGGAGPGVDLLLVAGAGIDRPEHGAALRDELIARSAAARVVVVNDTFAALRAATRDGVGLVVVAGTGCNVIGRGPSGRATGRGHGVFGGGYVLGALAVRALRRGDPRVSPALAAEIRAGSPDVTARRPGPEVAALAAGVIGAAEGGDAFAGRLVSRWMAHVRTALREEAATLGFHGPPRVVLYGGLVDAAPALRGRLEATVAAAIPGARIRHLDRAPVEGAALLARDAWPELARSR